MKNLTGTFVILSSLAKKKNPVIDAANPSLSRNNQGTVWKEGHGVPLSISSGVSAFPADGSIRDVSVAWDKLREYVKQHGTCSGGG